MNISLEEEATANPEVLQNIGKMGRLTPARACAPGPSTLERPGCTNFCHSLVQVISSEQTPGAGQVRE